MSDQKLSGWIGILLCLKKLILTKTKMSLISRIDELPDDVKATCASFAYGYTEEPEEHGDAVAFRVGADVYRFTDQCWYLVVFEPSPHGQDLLDNGECGTWEDCGTYRRKEDYLDAFAEYVGDKVWRGGYG